MVTAEANEGVQVTRNALFFKSAPSAKKAKWSKVEQEDAADDGDSFYTAAPPRCYPRRTRMRPTRLNDFICS